MRAISFSVALVLAAFLLTSVTAEVPDNSPPPGKVDQSPIGEFLPLAKELIESTEQLITHDDGFGGASVSEVQNNLYLYRFGFENTANNDERVADDFTINNPEGWFIETITFFAYEAYGQCDEGYGQEVVRTGNSAAASKSMPSLNLQIWNGPPNDDTSQVVWGDMSSNCLVSSSSSNIYRVDPYYHEDTSRLIMENVCDVNVTLGPGTYWLDWQTSTSDPETMEVCAPPITILGETGSPDANALQFITGAWIPVIDGDGYYYYYDEYPQGFPFVIEGSIICETLPAPTVKSVGGTSCGGNPSDTSPRLEWYDVLWDEGYEWQVRGASGKIVSRGATGKNRNFAAVDELEDGAYTARVKVRGDGVYFCNSNWGPDCPFTIGEVVGPGEEPVDFEWWPYQPKQGQQVRFADLTGGTPISWFWDFGDGWTSDQHHPSHVFDTAGEYTVTRDVELETGHVIEQKTITVAGNVECGDTMCEGQETAWSCPADCALPPDQTGRAGGSDRRPTVPAAAGGLRGANGTTWYTEGWVHNPGEEPARFILEYTPRNKTSILQAGPFDLEPGHTIYWDNIVEDLFHSTGSGALWIDSTVPVIFLTRTYTLDPGNLSKSSGGTFGAAQMATRERLTVGRGEGKLYLIGLREDGEFRSNLHFQNIDKELEITVEVEVFDNTGTLLSRQTFPINGHSLRQKGLGQHFGVSGVASAYATLEVIEGDGRLNSWASVIDNITGDFTFTDAVHSNQVAGKVVSEQHYLVAAVAHTTGVLNSVWRSGLDIFNEPTFPSQTVTLRFVAEYDRTGAVGEFLEKTVTVPSGEQLSWDDVLVDLFGVPENAKTQGALHIFSQDKLVVNSHTYNKRSDGGSLGMGLPGLTSGDLISADGRAGIMPGLTNSGDTRTNVGLAEYSGRDTQVSILFYSTDQENQLLNRNDPVKRNVPADEHLQLLNIFEQVEDLREITVEKIKAEVWVEGGGSIYSYATTIDNETGDPTAFTAAEE